MSPVFRVGGLSARIFSDKDSLGSAAAEQAASIVREAIRRRGRARIIVATGNSQLEMIASLVEQPNVDWSCVEVFHMDEYVGIPFDHPAGFRRWIKTRFVDKVRPAAAHYLEGDACDLDSEVARYAALLAAAPIDLSFVGFGENGHIAFNDPHVADFNDPLLVKRVTLDHACRMQQVGEGHFPTVESVPAEALTLTCPALFRAENWVCCVADLRKAKAVKCALEGTITTECPASIARTHPSAFLYLDEGSASLLSPETLIGQSRALHDGGRKPI